MTRLTPSPHRAYTGSPIHSLTDVALRVDPDRVPVPDLDLPGREATWLPHVRDAADMHLHLPSRVPRLRIPRGKLRRTLDHVPRRRRHVLARPDNDVAPRVASRVKPHVPRARHAERQLVVLPRALPHEDLVAV